MRIFKNKIFRRIVSILLLLCLFILLDTGVGELLRPVTYTTSFNHDLSVIEKAGQPVDMVFVGGSRIFYSFVPRVFEESLGLDCVLNAGSASQPLCATYFELKDLIERFHPRHVVIGVAWNQLLNTVTLQSRLIVYDRLSLRNRLLMAAECFEVSELPYLLATYRFKDNLDPETIRIQQEAKRKLAENNDEPYAAEGEYYADKGFVYDSQSYKTGTIPIQDYRTFSRKRIQEDRLKYLDACIDLCRKNGIEVTLISGPTTMMRIYTIDHYQSAVDYFMEYAEEKKVPYYNMNYLVGREDFLPDELMRDYNHTNGEGGRVVSEKLAEILKNAADGNDVSSYFYENLDALKKDVHRIVAVDADIKADPDDAHHYHVAITSVQNEDVEVVYRLLIKYSGEEKFRVVQNWTAESNLEFYLEKEKNCAVRVEAGSPDESVGHASQRYTVKYKGKKETKKDDADQD